MEVGRDIQFGQPRRVARAQWVAYLVVDSARQDKTIGFDPEDFCTFGQALHCQGRGIEQTVSNVADAIGLRLQRLAIDRLIQPQA
ncbi:hypothetical protein D3C80_1860070 [compost metagenome]